MSKAEEELARADARADEFRNRVREYQAELDKINGSTAGEMGDRHVWLESEIRRLKIEVARAYSPVLAALDEDLKDRSLKLRVIEPTIRFPVKCPECGNEKLTEFPVAVVVDALRRGGNICLVATCHDRIWDANDVEVEQIREYLGAIWLAAQR